MANKKQPSKASQKKNLPKKIVFSRGGHIYNKQINMSKNYFRYKKGRTEIESYGHNKHAVTLAYINTGIHLLKAALEVIIFYKLVSGQP